jgi:hypothetical protein
VANGCGQISQIIPHRELATVTAFQPRAHAHFLMSANLIVGLFILPAFIASRRSRFITRYESAAAAATPQALAESVRAERGGDT